MANDADTPLPYLMPRLSRSTFTELQPTMTGEEDFPPRDFQAHGPYHLLIVAGARVHGGGTIQIRP